MSKVIDSNASNRLGFFLHAILFCAVIVQIALCGNQLLESQIITMKPIVIHTLYPISLVLLIGIVVVSHVYHVKLMRRAQSGREQLQAMISMFSTVKHKLNNDMQVVLGNAELAEILANTGGDTRKPVVNITDAANAAVERIEQLSILGSTGYPNPTLIDVNAMLRESMAKLIEELPSMVTLHMELGQLSSRAVADRHLLSLSLANLIRKVAITMHHGGEIMVRTFEVHMNGRDDTSIVNAEIHFVSAPSNTCGSGLLCSNENRSDNAISSDISGLQSSFSMTKALVERSGVTRVRLAHTNYDSVFAMRFSNELRAGTVQDDIVVSRRYNVEPVRQK